MLFKYEKLNLQSTPFANFDPKTEIVTFNPQKQDVREYLVSNILKNIIVGMAIESNIKVIVKDPSPPKNLTIELLEDKLKESAIRLRLSIF